MKSELFLVEAQPKDITYEEINLEAMKLRKMLYFKFGFLLGKLILNQTINLFDTEDTIEFRGISDRFKKSIKKKENNDD